MLRPKLFKYYTVSKFILFDDEELVKKGAIGLLLPISHNTYPVHLESIQRCY
jgi:hypothetical protein